LKSPSPAVAGDVVILHLHEIPVRYAPHTKCTRPCPTAPAATRAGCWSSC